MDISLNYLFSLSYYLPECIAILTMIGIVFLEVTYKSDDTEKRILNAFVYIGLAFVLLSLVYNLGIEPKKIFYGAIVVNKFTVVAKIIAVLGTIAAFYFGTRSRDIYKYLNSEFGMLIVGAMVGSMLLASANNLLTFYLGIETLSILSYPLAALKRSDERSVEAGLKYAVYGGLSAGIMLFGMSFIFGTLGTIQFDEISTRILTIGLTEKLVLLPSFLLFFAGVGYKISSVPFHMWTPDVYEGSPIPVTMFFSTVPKIGGMAALINVTEVFFKNESILKYSWVGGLSIIAAMTMTVGNVSALGQKSVKRMLAFSSIAQIGNMLLGALVINEIGAQSVLFYFFGYLVMTIISFGITSIIVNRYSNDYFERFNGLIYKSPILALALIVSMFSLAGLPPFLGFVTKFNIISTIVNKGFYTLAIVAVLNSVISLYYYMRLVRIVVFKKPDSDEKSLQQSNYVNFIFIGLAGFLIVAGIFWENLYEFSGLIQKVSVVH